ncbi:MAG: sugar phosphate isomerase/epimerase [Spirochaetia bacterium]|nr:sugar phosphate isomerase/epimerase [Spirochaetia bacterium]
MQKQSDISIGVQTRLPENYTQDTGFHEILTVLSDLSCDHIELNVPYPEKTDGQAVRKYLDTYGLTWTNFATGGLHPETHYALSHDDPAVRKRTVEALKQVLEFCSKTGIGGIILGLIQGSSCTPREKARKHFTNSLAELVPTAEEQHVTLIVEATNRYLTNVANSLDDTIELIDQFPEDTVRLLPDTFHMNIEERDMFGALQKHILRYDSIHFSENNRYFPGYGAVDFRKVYKAMQAAGFSGRITVEGNAKQGFPEDMKTAVEVIRALNS